jgi:arginine-tRNA-protein transferase
LTVLQHLVERPHACPYLKDRSAQLELKVLLDVTSSELDAMLARGWRRFGAVYFRPACTPCTACVTLRIPTATFAPSKSQRRALKNAAPLVRRVSEPDVDSERLALYRKWHAARESKRGWEPSAIDPERYALDFAFPHPCVREVSFREPEGERLVGLGIVDETPTALSAVYFFWDPEDAPASLGVAHVVMLVLDAKARGLPYVYLGYRVEGCPSLAYKGNYRPHELLEGRPADDDAPTWRSQEARCGPSSLDRDRSRR